MLSEKTTTLPLRKITYAIRSKISSEYQCLRTFWAKKDKSEHHQLTKTKEKWRNATFILQNQAAFKSLGNLFFFFFSFFSRSIVSV